MPYKDPNKQKEWHAAWYRAHKQEHIARTTNNRRQRRATDPNGFRARERERYGANAEQRKQSWRKYKLKKPNQFRAGHYRRKYGITPEAVERMKIEQSNRCAICREEFEKQPHVDHDHSTKAVRKLLDFDCNRGLGCFGDNPALLFNAAFYLISHKDIPTIS